MSRNKQGRRDWKDIPSKGSSTSKAPEVRSSKSKLQGIWCSWNTREERWNEKSGLQKWIEIRPFRALDALRIKEFGHHPAASGCYFYTRDVFRFVVWENHCGSQCEG